MQVNLHKLKYLEQYMLAKGYLIINPGSLLKFTGLNNVEHRELIMNVCKAVVEQCQELVICSDITGGITNIDQWRITADVTSSGDITTNLSQNTFTNVGLLGSAMTESSGIFSFPSTGFWLVKFQGLIRTEASSSYGSFAIKATDNNSTYSTVSSLIGYGEGAYYSKTQSCEVILDITDLSNDKVKFTYTEGGTSKIDVSSDTPNFIFIRLTDT